MKLRVFKTVLGVILLALILMFASPVIAQTPTEDDFILDFGQYSSARDWACHADGWGDYVGVPSTCAQDFHSACDDPLPAPFSGTLYTYGKDNYGNPAAVLVGKRLLMTLLHGKFPDATNGLAVVQGQTVGWQASIGNSEGCHWHMGLFDMVNKVWVNPYTMALAPLTSTGDNTAVPRPPEKLLSMLRNINIVVSSTVVEVASPTPTTAVLQPTLQPEIISVEVMNLQNPTVIRFLITWGFITGLLIASGATAFGSKPTKATGIVLLIALAVIGYWLFEQGFRPVFELPAAAEANPPPAMDRQVEEVVVTNVVLNRLPGSAHNQDPPTSGECRIDPEWPQSIQQWCPWVTKYAIENGIEPDWVAAMMWQESRGNPNATSSVSATGLIQVMPSDGFIGNNDEAGRAAYLDRYGSIFNNRPTVEELLDPEYNLAYGTGYLGGLLRKHGSIWDALLYYGGPGYGNVYRNAVKSHYDCVVLNLTGICSPGLTPTGD